MKHGFDRNVAKQGILATYSGLWYCPQPPNRDFVIRGVLRNKRSKDSVAEVRAILSMEFHEVFTSPLEFMGDQWRGRRLEYKTIQILVFPGQSITLFYKGDR